MFVFKAHNKPISSLAYSPDGLYLASGCGDVVVHLWDAATRKKLQTLSSESYSHVRFSPDSRLLAAAGFETRVWSVDKPDKPLFHIENFANKCCFSPDGRVFATQGDDEPIQRWDTDTWESLPGGWGGTRKSNKGSRFPDECVVYHPEGKLVASSFGILGEDRYDSIIYLFDSQTGEEKFSLRSEFVSAHPTALAFSPDGNYLAGVYGPKLLVWDVKEAAIVAVRKVGKKHFNDVVFLHDGRKLITVNNDESVHVWEAPSWEQETEFKWKIGKLGSLAISPDRLCIAAGSATGKIVIWDID